MDERKERKVAWQLYSQVERDRIALEGGGGSEDPVTKGVGGLAEGGCGHQTGNAI